MESYPKETKRKERVVPSIPKKLKPRPRENQKKKRKEKKQIYANNIYNYNNQMIYYIYYEDIYMVVHVPVFVVRNLQQIMMLISDDNN